MVKTFKNFDPEHRHRITLFIDPAIIRKAKAQAALDALTLSEVVEMLLKKWSEGEIKIQIAE